MSKKPASPLRVAIYSRVSSDRQTTENQERELQAIAGRLGWIVVKVYRDQGISGSKGRECRPAFDALCKDANLAAAAASLPPGAAIMDKDPNGCWIVYELPNGAQQVRFRASEAWLPNEPTVMPNNTNITLAAR